MVGIQLAAGSEHDQARDVRATESAAEFRLKIAEAYRGRFGIAPQVYECRPAEGAGEVRGD
jgi:galactokinase